MSLSPWMFMNALFPTPFSFHICVFLSNAIHLRANMIPMAKFQVLKLSKKKKNGVILSTKANKVEKARQGSKDQWLLGHFPCGMLGKSPFHLWPPSFVRTMQLAPPPPPVQVLTAGAGEPPLPTALSVHTGIFLGRRSYFFSKFCNRTVTDKRLISTRYL